jgi:hypothetical protein
MLAVATVPHGLVAILLDGATLSQRLHTPPLPVTHALVGYRWQYIGLCPAFQAQQLFKRPRVALPNSPQGVAASLFLTQLLKGSMLANSLLERPSSSGRPVALAV